jgi:hypothetical protein
MGKQLTDEQIARYERDGFISPVDAFGREQARDYLERPKGGSRLSPGRRCYGSAALMVIVVLLSLTAGCASRDNSSDQERRDGFYGGVSGGLSSHP